LSVELAGDVALEATLDLPVRLAFGAPSFGVGAGGVVAEPGKHDDVQGPVPRAVVGLVAGFAPSVTIAG
jgi:hypothetical protein